MRSRRSVRQLAALAVVAAVASLAAAAPGGAGRQDGGGLVGQPSGLDVSAPGISLVLEPSAAPLPQKLVLQVPTGYQLDLGAPAGESVGYLTLALTGVGDTPSLALGFSELIARDPAAFLGDPAARACAPGAHAAVAAASLSIAGRPVAVTIFVDAGGAAGVAYTLQTCPTGLAGGSDQLVALFSLGLTKLVAPTAPGIYRWHAFATPAAGPAYEYQAVLPLPETATLHARYDKRTKTAVLTGKVLEAGQPLASADFEIQGETVTATGDGRNSYVEGRTKADGTFALRVRAARTTDFQLTVAATAVPCVGATAPGGCLGARAVPPEAAYATVWVSVPGGAVRAITAKDQRQAERSGLTRSDLPPGFDQEPGYGDACSNPAHESSLRITGEAVSPGFYRVAGDATTPASIVQAAGLTRVYATVRQARAAFDHQAVAATLRCELQSYDLKQQPRITALRLRGLPGRARGFTATLPAGDGFVALIDLVFLQRGRSVEMLSFVTVGVPRTVALAATARVAARLH